MKIYVAASAAPDAADRAAAAISALRAAGFTVTCTWPEIVAATPGGANPRDAHIIERRRWSAQDLNEIDEADCVWFLVPELPATTRGAWFESGYAYSSHKHLVFSGDTKQSVFCALGYEFATDAGALAHLVELRDREFVARRPSLAECKARFEGEFGEAAPFMADALPPPPIVGGPHALVDFDDETPTGERFDTSDVETMP